jgi:glycosyltransferase involved in cell wall biosynthesis
VPEAGGLDVRVALVLATSTGGVGRHVRSLAGGLVRAGVAVTVCGPAATEELFGFTGVGARFEAVEIAAGPRPGADLAAVRRLRRLLGQGDEMTGPPSGERRPEPEPAPDHEITGPSDSPVRGSGGPAVEPAVVEPRSPMPPVPAAHPSALVVHAHGLRAGLLAGLALGRDVPLVVTWHNAILSRRPRRLLLSAMERRVARRADVTLGASSDLVDRARALGARDARLAPVAAPPFPAASRLPGEVRAELGVPQDRPLLLAVGRLAPQKGYDLLLDAAAYWARLEPTPLVLIAGDGPLGPGLTARAEAEQLPVRLLGHREDVPDLLPAADIVVLTSVWEARALVAQEALRAGRPLVATAVGGVPELVGDAAVLVPAGNAALFAEAVAGLLADPRQRDRLSRLGREQAQTWPDDADTVRQVLAVYGELTGR